MHSFKQPRSGLPHSKHSTGCTLPKHVVCIRVVDVVTGRVVVAVVAVALSISDAVSSVASSCAVISSVVIISAVVSAAAGSASCIPHPISNATTRTAAAIRVNALFMTFTSFT